MAIKITIAAPVVSYSVFRGEFSGHWVATRTENGRVAHTVRRSTKDKATVAIHAVPDAPTLDLSDAAVY